MKQRKWIRLAALLLCLLLAIPALASGLGGRRGTVGRSGGISAYLDGEGGLYLTGYEGRVNARYAAEIVHLDDRRVVYLAGEEAGDIGGALMLLELKTLRETELADGVLAAVALSAGEIYYIPEDFPARLMRVSAETGAVAPAAEAVEHLIALHETSDGLVAETEEGALLYDAGAGMFVAYGDPIAAAYMRSEGYYLRLSEEGLLSIMAEGSDKTEFVDFGVKACAMLGGKVYYITSVNKQARLKVFDPGTLSWQMLTALDGAVAPQLAASAGGLFLLDEAAGRVYTFNLQTLKLEPFAEADLAGVDAPEGYELDGLRLEAMSGQINLYGIFVAVDPEGDAQSLPAFSFGDEEESEGADDVELLIATFEVQGEEKAVDVLSPEQYGSLSRGNRGEDVRKLQAALIDLGYLNGKADGIFGSQTQYAVRLLQTDLAGRGFSANGVADAELQVLLFSGTLPDYDPYKPLSRGDSGLRVSALQERLRALGFLADPVDGIYGARTEEAVALFESENGLSGGGDATADMLRRLYAAGAKASTSYIPMQRGDTGYRVKALNARLKELYYLEGTVGSTFNNLTLAALKRFQSEAGLAAVGAATPAVQRRLFAADAPEYSGYITLKRGDANDRVGGLQRRLKRLNYYGGSVTSSYGSVTEAAVRLFQAVAGLEVTGVADVETLTRLFARNAPVYVEPTATPTPSPSPTPSGVGAPRIDITPIDSSAGDVSYLDPAVKTITFTWSAKGDVSAYYVRVEDSQGTPLISQQMTSTRGKLDTSSMKANTIYTISVGAIPKNGTVDNAAWASRRFALKGTATPVPTASPTPTPAPTATPVPTATPTPAPGQVGIPDVSVEPVDTVGVDMVQYVPAGTLTLRWSAAGAVDHYLVEVLNGGGSVIASQEFNATSTTLGTKNMNEGEIYTLRVTAVPVNGTAADGKSNAVRFALAEPPVTEPPVTEPPVTEPPVTEPPVTEPPVTEPPVTEPPVGVVSAPQISFAPLSYVEDDIVYLSAGDVQVSWPAAGDVDGYRVIIRYLGAEDALHDEMTKNVDDTISAGALVEGALYQIDVVAIPINGTEADGVGSTAYFALEPTPEPAEVPQEPADAPEEPTDVPEEPADMPQEPVDAPEEPTDVPEEPADVPQEPVDAPEEPTDVPEEPADMPQEPVDAPEEPTDMPQEPTDALEPGDDPWALPLNSDGDAVQIEQVQRMLEQWGWLALDGSDGSAIPGTLDAVTLQAVYDFQTYVNEQLGGVAEVQLILIDLTAEKPQIEPDTLHLLMNDHNVAIYRP